MAAFVFGVYPLHVHPFHSGLDENRKTDRSKRCNHFFEQTRDILMSRSDPDMELEGFGGNVAVFQDQYSVAGTALSMEEAPPATKREWRSKEVRVAALDMLLTHTYADVCERFSVSRSTLYQWKMQKISRQKVAPSELKGRRKKLTDEQVECILSKLKANPKANNQELAELVGGHVHPSTISRYTRRAGISRRKSDAPAPTMDERMTNEIREYYQDVKEVPIERRVYVDETFVYNSTPDRSGMGPRAQRLYEGKERTDARWTLYIAVRCSGMVHEPILRKKSADDEEFLAYVRHDLVPSLRAGDVVIWDRLGRCGRCKNPQKQHYNPECRRLIEGLGAKIMFLPPKGKLFNPLYLVFAAIKGHLKRSYAASAAADEGRARTEGEFRSDLSNATRTLTPDVLNDYFHESADGRGFASKFPDIWELIN